MGRKRFEPDPELRLLKYVARLSEDGLDLIPTVYAGIDPGAEGAIGLVCGGVRTVIDIPTIKVKRGKGKSKTVFDHEGILDLFDCLRPLHLITFVVEEPPPNMAPGQGSAYGQFRLGCAFAMWPLFLLSKGFTVRTVLPSVWKRKMGLNSDKNRSLSVGRRLFHDCVDLLARKKDHNRCEALCLAEYGRRYH